LVFGFEGFSMLLVHWVSKRVFSLGTRNRFDIAKFQLLQIMPMSLKLQLG
jgi:hypothetical protein